ncbi:hypothetical protein PHYSODRAFT_297245 [Phytophthora sojae]|uniref:NADP-dependent 3-hydroxy acid dehydrogenase YdfG n=1 Tax=Phytophthora sojae (strain P6497) TaxID=1094619 RepID=G4YX91_PHYSP|nr:hypothetical protein PHYSODRAFT_297245 [Phytophthora sojae]EGZ25659.1 hypothetical protein PHYSODRAFT_297245 [Phytophthora sojae]|eukprot:XP_009520947.1 hypothetical protein PHYSODRAFT_297245 [Phytophthora sojae]
MVIRAMRGGGGGEAGSKALVLSAAGVMHVQLMKNVDQDSWGRMIDINCKGTLNGVAAVLPKMLAVKSGHIVNISSDAGRKVFAGLGVYSASKMFIEGISQALRLENVGSGLRVTSIQPGDVTTFLVDHANAVSGVDEEAAKMFDEEPVDLCPPHYVAVNEVLVQPRDSNNTQLSGKVAVVTGASGGIGAAIALELAKAGAKVALGARRLEALEAVKASIEQKIGAGDSILLVQTDVTKRQEVQNLVTKAEETLGSVDILVNNGGGRLVSFLLVSIDPSIRLTLGIFLLFLLLPRCSGCDAVRAAEEREPGQLGPGEL